MNLMIKKISLFVVVLLVSYWSSEYVGFLYDNMSFQDGGLMGSRNQAIALAGFFISYIFLIPFVFGLLGIKQNKKLITVALLPVMLLVIWADTSTFYVPILVVATALTLSFIIRSVLLKIKNI
jgi:hypothetical protein